MVQTLSNHPPSSLPYLTPPVGSLFPMALSRYVSQGKGRLLAPHCLGSCCISTHTHTHTQKQWHTHIHTSAGTQVLTQQIKRIVALPPAASLPPASRGWKVTQGFLLSHHMRAQATRSFSSLYWFEKFPGTVKVTLVSLTEKSVVL